MLHIILTILKIIGIIILAILGLIIFLLACILFDPIRYKAEVSYDKKLVAKVKVTYLMHIISLSYDKDRDNPIILRLFGIKTRFFSNDEKEKKQKYDKDTEMFEEMAKNNSESYDPFYEDEDEDEYENEIKGISDVPTENKQDFSKTDDETDPEIKEENDNNGDSIKRKSFISKIISKIKGIISKIKYIFKSIYGTIKKVLSSADKTISFLREDSTKEAISLIKTELKELFMHIRPRSIRGHVHFGFEDPSVTGKVLGLIYIITKGRGKKFYINPDFEKNIFEGEIYVKGRIQIYKLLIIAWHIYKNENIKTMIKKRRT